MENTIDTSKNYVGKVLKVYYNSFNSECSQTGIVFAQQKMSDNSLRLSMLLTNGQVCDPIPFAITKVTSTRIDPDLRRALEDYCAAKVKQTEFLKQFWKEKSAHENTVATALEKVKDHSPEVSYDTFMMTAEKIFQDRWPAKDEHWRRRYFQCSSISPRSITMCQVQQFEKYATHEQYPFLYREYDGNLFIDDDHPQYERFCECNAPPVIPLLEDHCKISVSASIGDKNWLSVSRNYTFPLKFGLTKQGLNHLRDIVLGNVQEMDSLTNKLADAKNRSCNTSATNVKQEHTKINRARRSYWRRKEAAYRQDEAPDVQTAVQPVLQGGWSADGSRAAPCCWVRQKPICKVEGYTQRSAEKKY